MGVDLMKIPLDTRLILSASHLHAIEEWANAEVEAALKAFDGRIKTLEHDTLKNRVAIIEFNQRLAEASRKSLRREGDD